MENNIDNRAHICYICNGEGATTEGDCPCCLGSGVIGEEQEAEIEELKWSLGEIEIALELLAEMRQAIKEFYGYKDIASEDDRFKKLGRKVVEWFD